MNNKNKEDLLIKLVSADSEDQIKNVIESNDVLSNQNNWRPYGGYETNFNTIDNQQKNPVAALIEKPINSIDALLIKECKLRKIDPKSPKAPKTMQEAVEKFFDIKKGDFSEVGQKKRRELASNIRIIIEGKDRKPKEPNIVVVDKGEGQHPSDFEKTFVWLHGENKREILFVQGKYNMGSTGVLPNCGRYNYQLILSRKTPELLTKEQKDLWGFTLVRLHPAGKNHLDPWYEYFINDDDNIMSFPGRSLKILPEAKDVVDSEKLEYGTYVKMYNYDLPESVRSLAQRDLWRAMNKALYFPALPMLIQDTRYEGHSDTKSLLGNRVRIFVDDNDKVEDKIKFPISIETDFGEFGKRQIEITVFKEGINKIEFTSQDEAIFFTINGQSHASIGRSFLKTKNKANLHYLADYMLVHIDCSDVDNNVKKKIFMPSRDRMRENTLTKSIEKILAEELSKHEGLKQLNQYRREQKIIENSKDEEFMAKVMNKLLKTNPALSRYLNIGEKIKTTGKIGETEIKEFKGSYFPTFLKIFKHKSKQGLSQKNLPINSYMLMKFETDAANDYLNRELDGGVFGLEPDIMKSRHLWNGLITTKIIPPKNVKVGDIKKIKAQLTRMEDEPLEVEFVVKITPAIEKKKNGGGTQRPPKTTSYKLPKPVLVYKNPTPGGKTWEELDAEKWNENYISEVIPGGNDDIDIFINMDTGVLHDFLRRQQSSDKKIEEIKRTYQTSIFLHSLLMYNELKDFDELERILPTAMKAVAKITLDLIWNEGLIKSMEELE